MSIKRTVFFISDRTGITSETLGHALLTQFEGLEFRHVNLPFINTLEKAQQARITINRAEKEDGCTPLIFSTLIDDDTRTCIEESNGLVLDFFDAFIGPLETALGIRSSHTVGRSHGMGVYDAYKQRIDAVNYALRSDDGMTTQDYRNADVILVGVSRAGKTPTCLYLALQYRILAANYPLTEEDFASGGMPAALEPYQDRIFGLTIDPVRLQQIRSERRPHSHYASAEQCASEVQSAESLYRRYRIPYVDTSSVSIEEIATTILQQAGLKRKRG